MIKPTKGNVYVHRTGTDESKTTAGIIIPDAVNTKNAHERVLIYGKVQAIGEDITQVAVGDLCVFPRYEGWPLNEKKSKDDIEFVVPEKFIFAKVIPTS